MEDFSEATFRFPANATRVDFGFALGKWTNWCICDLRWYVGKGRTPEEANADMLHHYMTGAEIGRMKELRQASKPRELDGRTREGRMVKSSMPSPLSTQALKDMF